MFGLKPPLPESPPLPVFLTQKAIQALIEIAPQLIKIRRAVIRLLSFLGMVLIVVVL